MNTYYVFGMHCDGCVRRVRQLIAAIAGVNLVEISLVTSKVTISANRDVGFEEIATSLKDSGYDASRVPPAFTEVFKMFWKKYMPLIIAFSAVTFWMIIHQSLAGWSLHFAMHDFMGGFFILFGGLKVFNWRKFAESYQGYDLLAMKIPAYAYIYPAIEVFLGIAYQFRISPELILNIATVLVLGIATVGIVQVLKQNETVKCACLGGYFNIPITWFTVFENALMMAMAIYMQIAYGKI